MIQKLETTRPNIKYQPHLDALSLEDFPWTRITLTHSHTHHTNHTLNTRMILHMLRWYRMWFTRRCSHWLRVYCWRSKVTVLVVGGFRSAGCLNIIGMNMSLKYNCRWGQTTKKTVCFEIESCFSCIILLYEVNRMQRIKLLTKEFTHYYAICFYSPLCCLCSGKVDILTS